MTSDLRPSAPILRLRALRWIEQAYSQHGLMERAGQAAAAWAAELCKSAERPLLIVAGPGNNGGDAFVAARLLKERFYDVHVAFAGEPTQLDRLPPDADAARERLLAAGIALHRTIPEQTWGLIIDGILGVGLTRAVIGEPARTIAVMQAAAAASGCPLLALDCPSGLDCETGRTPGACVTATHTLSFLALKPGLLMADGPDRCGELRVAPLQLSDEELSCVAGTSEGRAAGAFGRTIGADNVTAALKIRRANSHKGSYGSAGIIGGAPGMLGAALLAGRAALHAGAGRVFAGLLDAQAASVDPIQPELMLRVGAELAGQLLDPAAVPLTALAAGPGMGRGEAARTLVERALATTLPLILDADALNILAGDDDLRTLLGSRPAPTVLTPHPAEAARLLACNVDDLQADRLAAAVTLARTFKAWIVLKGNGTIVVSPAEDWWINTSGNASLATAGSGDVLSGLLVALLAQGGEPGSAIRAAVHLHGAAADDWATAHGGQAGLCAGELIPAARDRLNAWLRAPRDRAPQVKS
jgi:ADP-dependent NAD(P)H-hydrate dehydratase / NAD(P)H-hydrate epimerase